MKAFAKQVFAYFFALKLYLILFSFYYSRHFSNLRMRNRHLDILAKDVSIKIHVSSKS